MVLKIIIKGGKKLSGEVAVRGAKNSVLELIPATLLTDEKVVLNNVPNLNDVETICELMKVFGTEIEWDKEKHTLSLQTKKLKSFNAPYDIVKKMRASIYVLGALLGRCGQANVSFPGGCVLGPRPIDIHINIMQKLGAEVDVIHGDIIAKAVMAENGVLKLQGANVDAVVNVKDGIKITSCGATVNAVLAAVLANGQTVINNAAMEPEVDDLINMLKLMGAKIARLKLMDGNNTIVIDGVEKIGGCKFFVMPDRIEALSYAIVGALNGGVVRITNTDTTKYGEVLKKFLVAGVAFEISDDCKTLTVDGTNSHITSVDLETFPYPEFPTDILPPFMTMLALADGKSRIQENVLNDRFQCVSELRRMGAIADFDTKNPKIAYFTGVKELSSTTVIASDLRSGFALVIAGLVANHGGTTEVLRGYHITRGYDNFVANLKALGADIEKGFYDE